MLAETTPDGVDLAPVRDRVRSVLAPSGAAVSVTEYFSPAFMREHTRYESFGAFCEDGPIDVAGPNDLRIASRGELDRHVATTTEFDSWRAMRNRAGEAAVVDRLLV